MTDLESKSLLERPLDPDLAKATLNEIHAGQGQRIFKVIFKHLSENAPSKAMAVQAAMTKFEKIMQSSTELGIYLMCQLDSIAGKFNHEVYNAIELWALSLRSEQAAAMVELCAADAGPHRRARLLNWARVMRSPGA